MTSNVSSSDTAQSAASYAAVTSRDSSQYLRNFVGEIRTSVTQNEKLDESREAIFAVLETLSSQGHLVGSGSDAADRPVFVGLQGVIENLMALKMQQGEITKVVGIIHTPTPTTPLCTKGEVTDRLVDAAVATDPKRKYTIVARAQILREWLVRGGVLFTAYPKGGLEKRTADQQSVYQEACATYSGHLHDTPLDKDLPANMIGATYVMTNKLGEHFLFAIIASQANAPKAEGQKWELWLGPLRDHQHKLDATLQAIALCGADLQAHFPTQTT